MKRIFRPFFYYFFALSFLIIVSETSAQDIYTLKVDDQLTMDFVPVAGGSFTMGQGNQKIDSLDNTPEHTVQIDGFWMGAFEVDWEQYEAFVFQELEEVEQLRNTQIAELGIDGISSASAPYVDMSEGMGKEGYPAINMTQYAALMFCKWLSAKTGDFYRLPTEAEWEYACVQGYDAPIVDLDSVAWYEENTDMKYEPVGSKEGNKLGLFDMLGNVSEWTMDQYAADFYVNSDSINPWNVPSELYPRVLRGGSWKDSKAEIGCKTRFFSRKQWKIMDPQMPKSEWWLTNAPNAGFRVVRPFIKPSAEEIKKYWLPLIEDYN